jgi:hypothetical protein
VRLRFNLYALGLLAAVGLFGCKSTHPDSSATAPAGSCADGLCDAHAKSAAATGCSACTSCAASSCTSCGTCTACVAPSASPAPNMAAIAGGCGCASCAANAFPTTITPVAATTGSWTSEPMLVGSTLPGSVPPSVGVVPANLPPALATNTPPPLGPGIETVSTGGAPILLANGDKLLPQSTMTVRFGESNNYGTLVGQVSQFRHTWRLRYTAVESDDKLGGSVILVGNDLDQLKEGQMVRVQGSVLPGEDRVTGTRYQVTRFDVIDPGKQ